MDLLHFSSEPLTAVRSTPQKGSWAKPDGLWLSVGTAWAEWCETESFGGPRACAHATRITLAKNANVLSLSTVEALVAFGDQYREGRIGIAWQRVAAKYDGIIISPYQFALRWEDGCEWYYPWDIASGCIWQARAVAKVAAVTL